MSYDRDILIEDSIASELSTRALNSLKRKGFETIGDVIDYYNKYGDFLLLPFCGEKSNRELIDLIENYINSKLGYSSNNIDVNTHFDELEKRQPPSPAIEKLFIIQFKILLTRFSPETMNLVWSKIGEKCVFNDISNLHISDFDNQKINPPILNEIITLILEYTSRLNKLLTYKTQLEVEREIFKSIFYRFNIDNHDISRLFDEIKYTFDYYPVFRIVDFLIKSGNIFKNHEDYIFKNYLKYYIKENYKESLEEVGLVLNLTRERVRQIRNNLLKKFSDQFNVLSAFSTLIDFQQHYNIDLNDGFIYLTDRLVDSVNQREETAFSKLFMCKVFIALTNNKYLLAGYELNYHTTQQRKKHLSFKIPFLISRELNDYFNLKAFINDVEKRHEEGIKDTYSLNLKAYISRFCEDIDLDKLNKLERLCKIILFNEFDMIINYKNELVFERNKKKLAYELALEAIEIMGACNDGYHINLISDKIKDLYPNIDYTSNIASLRSTMNRHKNIFIHFGRDSRYGLKSWENEYDNIKGGTIRDIVEEFLLGKDSPQHIAIILEHVNKYRDTNEDNIIGNLKLDESKTFLFFEGRFIGLKRKKYATKDLNFVSVQGSIFTKESLNKYLPNKFNNVVYNICSDYDLRYIQVSSILKKQIHSKILIINDSEILRINYE